LSNIDSTLFKDTPRWTTLSSALFLLHDRGPVTVQFLIGLPSCLISFVFPFALCPVTYWHMIVPVLCYFFFVLENSRRGRSIRSHCFLHCISCFQVDFDFYVPRMKTYREVKWTTTGLTGRKYVRVRQLSREALSTKSPSKVPDPRRSVVFQKMDDPFLSWSR
jgi:hypothetical protein